MNRDVCFKLNDGARISSIKSLIKSYEIGLNDLDGVDLDSDRTQRVPEASDEQPRAVDEVPEDEERRCELAQVL